jgi:hypothetical protein
MSALASPFPAIAAPVTYVITGNGSANEHSCTWITAVFQAADCTFANTIALLNPISQEWSGPTRQGGFYPRGSAGDNINYNPNDAVPATATVLDPDSIKTAPVVVGSVTIDDNGTPGVGTDDTIALNFKLQGATPLAGIARNVSTGQTTRSVQRFRSMAHTVTPYTVNAALPRGAGAGGGFDYIIGSRGTPTRICRALNPGVDNTFDPDDCYPSNNYDKDSAQPAPPSWWAPRPVITDANRVGIERSVNLTNKPGPTTGASPGNEIPNIGMQTTAIFEPDADPSALAVLGNDVNLGPTGANTVSITTAPNQGGTATPNADGTVNYQPALGFTGTESFGYEVCFDGECDEAVVTLSVEREFPAASECATNNAVTNECLSSPLVWGGGEDAGFDNMVGILSTDASGNLVGADFYYTQEYNIGAFGGTGQNSWQGGTLTFTGTSPGPDPAALDDTFAVLARFEVTAGPRAITLDTRGRRGNAAAAAVTIPTPDLGVRPTTVTLDTSGDPAKGQCTVADNVITYTPTDAFVAGAATDTCNYTLVDSTEDSDSGTITITITDVAPTLANGAPRDVDAGASVNSDAAFTAGNGVVAQHVLSVQTQGTGGTCSTTVVGTNVRVTYTADSDFSGDDSCLVRLADADGDFAEATFAFEVEAQSVSLPGGGAIDLWSLALLGGLPLLRRRRR